ncbi:MAG: hypothetical protein WBG44_05050 [Comamonas sp.]
MKRALVILALASIAACAVAGGRYDGIYAHPLSNAAWVSLHHDDTRVVAAAFSSSLQFDGSVVIATAIGVTIPSVMNTWDLLGGPLSGNVAIISGEVLFGACQATMKIVLADGSFQLFPVSSVQTAQGKRTNFSCQNAFQGVSWPLTYKRIF